jgi:hypothetical protein
MSESPRIGPVGGQVVNVIPSPPPVITVQPPGFLMPPGAFPPPSSHQYYAGDIFGAVLECYDPTNTVNGPLVWGADGSAAPGGWCGEPTTGPAVPTSGLGGYVTITVNAIVRVHVRTCFSGVGGAGSSASGWVHQVKSDGTIIVLDSLAQSWGGGFYVGYFDTDIHNVNVEAGDKIIAGGVLNVASDCRWRNYGINDNYLRVGRGTISFGTCGNWTGP